ncbi:uncharacterized protein METZ01_LOCUS106882 [marine metagenome]|uniref:Cupin 2 conserved barrel domain-containing protein n=1 Tax=marine metagenome TaxID=408172 RepID=A0A381WP94_9ZZZZ
MLQQIKHNDDLFALIYSSEDLEEGINFVTDDEAILQLGAMKRAQGYVIEPHIHTAFERNITGTNEVMYLQEGRVKVTFFTEDKKFLEEFILEKGQWIVFVKGGHGFEMLETSVLIEVKNGPYAHDMDKIRFVNEE